MESDNNSNHPYISVVIPVYGCRACLYELYSRLVNTLESINHNFEIIMVNDACPQNSWEILKELAEKDQRVRAINLSRNFGQLKAVLAGLDCATGDWIVVMDCDLQDSPEEITRLYNKAQEGYDAVFGRRNERKDTLIKRFNSFWFYKFYNYFTDGAFDHSLCNYSICSRIVIDNYLKLREQSRAFTLFIKWMGFNQAHIDIDHVNRADGKSSYTLKKRWNLAQDIITTQSNKPLRFSIGLGMFVSMAAFIYTLGLVIQYLLHTHTPVSGWTSLIVSLYFLSGLILMNIGIVGIYIGKIFDETKARPIYIIKDMIN